MSVYDSIIQGLKEAVDYENGKSEAKSVKCTVNPVPDFSPKQIKEARLSLGMTQVTFSAVMGVSTKTVEAWESGTNKPIGSARRLLSLLTEDPAVLSRCEIIKT